MICSISGAPAQDPVVSAKSGAIFDRHHLLDYIRATGTDPITNASITTDDIISINIDTTTPPLPHTSVPSLLGAFQKEWDAVALELYSLRKQLASARSELSVALYKYDAAARVAATAIRERDEAREALSQVVQLKANGGQNDDGETPVKQEKEEIDDESLENTGNVVSFPESFAEEITTAQQKLFAQHKSNKIRFQYDLSLANSETLPSPSFKKVVSASVDRTGWGFIVGLTSVYGYDVISQATVKPAVKQAVTVAMAGDEVIIAKKKNVSFGEVTVEVSGVFQILVHPQLSNVVLLVNDHGVVVIHDKSVLSPSITPTKGNITTAALHVDGVLLAIGTDDGIEVFKLDTQELALSIETKYPHIDSLVFGMNGYWLVVASSGKDGAAIEVIDLRKNVSIHTWDSETKFSGVAIDDSCELVAGYGNQVQIWQYSRKQKVWGDAVELDGEYVTGSFVGSNFVGVTPSVSLVATTFESKSEEN